MSPKRTDQLVKAVWKFLLKQGVDIKEHAAVLRYVAKVNDPTEPHVHNEVYLNEWQMSYWSLCYEEKEDANIIWTDACQKKRFPYKRYKAMLRELDTLPMRHQLTRDVYKLYKFRWIGASGLWLSTPSYGLAPQEEIVAIYPNLTDTQLLTFLE